MKGLVPGSTSKEKFRMRAEKAEAEGQGGDRQTERVGTLPLEGSITRRPPGRPGLCSPLPKPLLKRGETQSDSSLAGCALSGQSQLQAAQLASPPLLGSLGCSSQPPGGTRALTQGRTHLLPLQGRVCELRVLTCW